MQLLSVNLLSTEFADQIFSTIAIVDPTQPIGQPNPWTTLRRSQYIEKAVSSLASLPAADAVASSR